MNEEDKFQMLLALTERYIEQISDLEHIEEPARAAASAIFVLADYLEEFGHSKEDVGKMYLKAADFLLNFPDDIE